MRRHLCLFIAKVGLMLSNDIFHFDLNRSNLPILELPHVVNLSQSLPVLRQLSPHLGFRVKDILVSARIHKEAIINLIKKESLEALETLSSHALAVCPLDELVVSGVKPSRTSDSSFHRSATSNRATGTQSQWTPRNINKSPSGRVHMFEPRGRTNGNENETHSARAGP